MQDRETKKEHIYEIKGKNGKEKIDR